MNLARLTLFAALCVAATPALADPSKMASVGQTSAANVAGIWQSQSGVTRVRVSPCGAGLCGQVVWQKSPQKDVHNPDPAKRERPVVGLQLVSNMKQVGPNEWKGSIYNYEDGQTYSGKVTVVNGNSIQIGGCVMGGVICQSKTWTKVN